MRAWREVVTTTGPGTGTLIGTFSFSEKVTADLARWNRSIHGITGELSPGAHARICSGERRNAPDFRLVQRDHDFPGCSSLKARDGQAVRICLDVSSGEGRMGTSLESPPDSRAIPR